jgi:hypothetical protein
MLPDFRVVVIAVISTFLLTVSVAFYTSARLGHEPRKSRPESLAAFDDSPVNRIALNWPEPVQPQTPPLDLGFAVSANGVRNPVREIASDADAVPAQAPAAAASEAEPAARQTEEKTEEKEQPAQPEKQAAVPQSAPDPVVTATIPAPAAKVEPVPLPQPAPAPKIASRTESDPAEAAPPAESAEKATPAKKRAVKTKKTKPAKAAKPEPAQTKTVRRARPRATTAAGAANRSGFPFNLLGKSFQN